MVNKHHHHHAYPSNRNNNNNNNNNSSNHSDKNNNIHNNYANNDANNNIALHNILHDACPAIGSAESDATLVQIDADPLSKSVASKMILSNGTIAQVAVDIERATSTTIGNNISQQQPQQSPFAISFRRFPLRGILKTGKVRDFDENGVARATYVAQPKAGILKNIKSINHESSNQQQQHQHQPQAPQEQLSANDTIMHNNCVVAANGGARIGSQQQPQLQPLQSQQLSQSNCSSTSPVSAKSTNATVVQFRIDSASSGSGGSNSKSNDDRSKDKSSENANCMSSISVSADAAAAADRNTIATTTSNTTTTTTSSSLLQTLSANHLQVPSPHSDAKISITTTTTTTTPIALFSSKSSNIPVTSKATTAISLLSPAAPSLASASPSLLLLSSSKKSVNAKPGNLAASIVPPTPSSASSGGSGGRGYRPQPSYYTSTTTQRMSDLRKILHPEVEKEDSFKKFTEAIENCDCFEFNLNNAAKLITVLVLLVTLLLVIRALQNDR